MNQWCRDAVNQCRDCVHDYGKVATVSALLVILFVEVLHLAVAFQQDTLRIHFFDVGQGDAILVETPSGHTMLVDGGIDRSVVNHLKRELGYFVHDIDVVVNTHPDIDHSTGLIPVYQMYAVGDTVMSPVASHTGIFAVLEDVVSREGAPVHIGRQGDVIDFGDGVIVRVLYPPKNFHGSEKETNDASVSLLITYGEESVLLTGDLPSTHEGELISGELPHNVTIYKAGHHGSKYSSSNQLLSYMHPTYSVISAGKDNRYEHPNPEALERLTKYSKEILSTIDSGTITFTLTGELVTVTTEK